MRNKSTARSEHTGIIYYIGHGPNSQPLHANGFVLPNAYILRRVQLILLRTLAWGFSLVRS